MQEWIMETQRVQGTGTNVQARGWELGEENKVSCCVYACSYWNKLFKASVAGEEE